MNNNQACAVKHSPNSSYRGSLEFIGVKEYVWHLTEVFIPENLVDAVLDENVPLLTSGRDDCYFLLTEEEYARKENVELPFYKEVEISFGRYTQLRREGSKEFSFWPAKTEELILARKSIVERVKMKQKEQEMYGKRIEAAKKAFNIISEDGIFAYGNGIFDLRLDHEYVVLFRNHEAGKDAIINKRAFLESGSNVIKVPKEIVAGVIGRSGKVIQSAAKEIGVKYIKVMPL